MHTQDRTVQTRHAEIRVRESAGKGFPLLMIHGSGASKDVFARQFAMPMAERHRFVAIDLPGHGESTDAVVPAESYTIHGFSLAVGEVLDKLGIAECAVYGWSLGGHVGIELLSWNKAVAGLMITGTPPIPRGPFGMLRGFQTHRDVFLASKPVFTDEEAQRFAKVCYAGTGAPEFVDGIKRADGRARKILTGGMWRGHGADQKRTLEETDVPVAVINGAEEPFARLGYVSSIDYGNLWDHKCYALEGLGHAPFWQSPETFNPLLERFVADVTAFAAHRAAEPRKLARAG